MSVQSGQNDNLTFTSRSFNEQPLVEAALKLAFHAGYENICSTLMDAAEAMLHAKSSWVLLHDARSNCLVTAAVRGQGADAYAGVKIPSNKGIVGLAFSTAEPVFVPEVALETRWYDPTIVHRSGLPSIFTVPLMHAERPVGVLGFYSPRFGPAALPSPADRKLLRALGAMATLALTGARLRGDLVIERRKRARVAQQRRGLLTEVIHLRREIRDGVFGTLVGDHPRIHDVLQQARLVAPAESTVLLLGETGTGKELVARVIHDWSRRAGNIFVPVNCASLPSSLVESELFGHEKGAFTGAIDRKPGKFELAENGTIFLDEIGDLPLEAQAKLLRVLQEREVTRVGGTKVLCVNTRVIAATNQDLLSRVQSGLFRADLYYRLSVFPIELPSLRERRDDIRSLVVHFVQRFAERLHTDVPAIDVNVMERLTSYDWPGNVRELQNVVERAVILARGECIRAEMVAACIGPVRAKPRRRSTDEVSRVPAPVAAPRAIVFAEVERRTIVNALSAAGWRVSGKGGAAEMLRLKPTTLHAKMKKLGVSRPSTSQSTGDADEGSLGQR